MQRDDVQLIRSILSGNDEAFSALVHKYKKGVHALAWRKIGDFHHAEEITQDTFLQAYKKLSTLNNPNQFAGWLYVIANRLCLNWMRKKKLPVQSLEGTSVADTERFSYSHYVSEAREIEASEHRSEIVKKLLAILPESERTVMTLYYLGEMPAKEIGKFLGVSVKTVHSRLHRARKRLQAKDELLISEVLGGVQLPASLMENITRQVANIKPAPSPAGKPLLPWAAFGAATVLMILLLGASNQYLARFQKPYSFEAQSEPTIEIIDAFVVVDIDAKPAVRHQVGRAATPGKSSSTGLQSTEIASTSNTQDDLAKFSTSQWTQTNGPYGGTVRDIFVTSDRTVYAAAPTGVYRLTPDATAWTLINTNVPNGQYRTPMAEHGNALYIASTDNISTSTDNGETWNILCSRPKGHPVGLIVTDEIQGRNAAPRPAMYLALQDKGIFRSTDAGVQWNSLKNGLAGKHIYAMAAIENTVFASTNEGLYRLNNSDVWQQLEINTSGPVYWVAGFKNNLYIEVGHNLLLPEWLAFEPKQKHMEQLVFSSDVKLNRIFHSTDLGASWTEITDKNESEFMSPSLGTTFLAHTGETLLPQGIVAAEKNTFYRANPLGIHRTTDGGQSWHAFMNGIIGTTIHDLVAMNGTLYVNTGQGFLQSVNGGETWETVRIDSNNQTLEVIQEIFPSLNFDPKAVTNDVLYGIVSEVSEKNNLSSSQLSDETTSIKDHLRIFELSAGDNRLVPLQGAPTFERESSFIELWTAAHVPNHPKKGDNSLNTSIGIKYAEIGGFAVTGQTFYAEWKRKLFKWIHGDSDWTDTGLIDNSEPPKAFDRGFKLAASGEVVYVGKRDGTLFQSLDGGKSWKNITPTLPLQFTCFKEIVFASATVYVATDEGVLVSQNGEHWRVLTDRTGARIAIDRFAVNHTRIYGADNTDVYRLDAHGKWDQISQNVPDKIVSLVVSNDRLYIATQRRGIFHIPLEEQL